MNALGLKQKNSLSASQVLILKGIAMGIPVKLIAATMKISMGTVQDQMKMTCVRLEANNKTQAVIKAIKLGLIDINSLHKKR